MNECHPQLNTIYNSFAQIREWFPTFTKCHKTRLLTSFLGCHITSYLCLENYLSFRKPHQNDASSFRILILSRKICFYKCFMAKFSINYGRINHKHIVLKHQYGAFYLLLWRFYVKICISEYLLTLLDLTLLYLYYQFYYFYTRLLWKTELLKNKTCL